MYFDPKTKKYPYPNITDQHYLEIKKNDGTIFDSHYPYFDKSKWFKFKQGIVRVLLYLIVFPFSRIKIGLKIENKKNLKKYKDVISNGIVSVSNHIHLWDYISIMKAIRPIRPCAIVWAKNMRGENKSLIRLVGGIPIPDNDLGGSVAYMKAVGEYLTKDKGWLHIYAEGSMWEYYAPIRPFKKGAAYFSIKYNKPILPLGFSFRKPSWIRKNLFHQPAAITLKIGEPIFPNTTLDKESQIDDLTFRSFNAVSALTGKEPKDNIYNPIFNNDKRVDYY